MTTLTGTIKNGQVVLDRPADLPDDTRVIVMPGHTAGSDDGPMSPEEIDRVLAAMENIQPFEMTPEEEAEIEAGRQRRKEYTIAHMDEGIEDLFP